MLQKIEHVIFGLETSHFVPRQSVPGHISSQDKMSPAGTLCGPIWHNFAVHEGNISSQGTFHPDDISCQETNRPGSWIFGIKFQLLASNGNFWQEMAMFGWFLIVFHAFGVVFDGIAYICTNIHMLPLFALRYFINNKTKTKTKTKTLREHF